MRILLTNDDGIYAPGIFALAVELRSKHKVYLCAPDVEKSASSHALTIKDPMRAWPKQIHGLDEITAYAVGGTPADCVKLGLGNLTKDIDIVVSGINSGYNTGTDVIYSGTVAAAMEGAILKKPSFAVSLEAGKDMDFEKASKIAVDIIETIVEDKLFLGSIININIPLMDKTQTIKGIKVCPLGVSQYPTKYVKRQDLRGIDYYLLPFELELSEAMTMDCDLRWTREGYVTVTPLHFDFTDFNTLKELKTIDFNI